MLKLQLLLLCRWINNLSTAASLPSTIVNMQFLPLVIVLFKKLHTERLKLSDLTVQMNCF